MQGNDIVSIGQLAERTGLSVSAIRYYETEGLVHPARSKGGRRLFIRADIRRLSFVAVAQQLGFSIRDIRAMLAGLPNQRAPTRQDWARLSTSIRHDLSERIAVLERMRTNLDGCIGCGCLSLKKCHLYNPDDVARKLGTGARYLMSSKRAK